MKFKKILLVLLLLSCLLLLNWCSISKNNEVYVTKIEKTEKVGLTQTYTVYYSDGKTSTISINDGEDGEDSEITIDDIYQKFLETNPNVSFEEGIHLVMETVLHTDWYE